MSVRISRSAGLACIAAVVAAAVTASTGCGGENGSAPRAGAQRGLPGAAVGDLAPGFETMDSAGVTVRLGDLLGPTTLFNFFCGCDPCRRLAKAQAGLLNRFAEVTVITVGYLDPAAIPSFRRDTGLGGRFLRDPFGDIGAAYEALDCPQCLVLEQGRIAYRSPAPPADTTAIAAELRRVLERSR